MSYDSKRTYKKVEIIGIAGGSFEAAIQAGIDKASTSLQQLSWFEVQEMRGHIGADGKISEYQVVMKVAFELK